MPRPPVRPSGPVRLAPLAVGFALMLSACSPEGAGSPVAPTASAAPAPAPHAAPAPGRREDTRLWADAERALAENRLHSPAGDNAVELYLVLRGRGERPDPAIETALLDLSPYVVNGVEQATADGDWGEATRRLALLRTIDTEAPALPRLQAALESARRAEQAQADAAGPAARGIATAARASAAAASDPARAVPAPTVAPQPLPRPTAVAPTASVSPPPALPAPAPASPPVAATVPAASRRIVAQPSPRFPEQALRRRLEGSVDLRLRVAPDGRVLDAAVVASSNAVFEREAVLAARRWRYAPAETATDVRVAVAFRLPQRS